MDRVRILSVILLSLVVFANSQSAAGMFANSGETMIGVEGSFDFEDIDGGSQTETNIIGSYVMDGNIELMGQLDMISAESDEDSYYDSKIYGFSFGGYYHVKDSESLPLNLCVGGFYGTATADGDWLEGVDMTSNGSGFGGGAYKAIVEKENLIAIGFFNIHSVTTTVEISGGNFDFSEDDSFVSMQFGVSMRNKNLTVSPTVTRVEDSSSFGVSIGLLLPQ